VQARTTSKCLDLGSRFRDFLLALVLCAGGEDDFVPRMRFDVRELGEPIEFFQIKRSTVWVLSLEGETALPLELTQSVSMRQRL
jgi:hypothetical protein